MGCLFGYAGLPDDTLLSGMASRLSHRCRGGWERTRLRTHDHCTVEIGRGIPPWSGAGRVYHHPEKRTALGYSGVIFHSTGGSAVRSGKTEAKTLLSRLGNPPAAGLPALEGAFTAALAEEDALHLVRDPSGVKVLYWARHRNRLLFASEIKALFADPAVSRRMRLGALPEYLTFSFIPGEKTMFEEIHELQPGTVLEFRKQAVRLRRHFTFEDSEWRPNDPIVHRPKSGMMVPVRFWFQKEMRRYARRVLSPRNLKRVGFFNPDYVKKLLRYDKTEIQSQRHGLKLWMLITFMLWHEQMAEGKTRSK